MIAGARLVHAQGAVLSFSPTAQTVKVNDTLTVTILLNTNGEQINRVLSKVNFDRNLLSPQSIDQTGSFVTLWFQQNITTPGVVTLEGGVSGGGVSGSQLTFAKINFTATKEGSVTISFAGDSAVYRESDATNILTEAQSVTYTIESITPTAVPTFGSTSTPTPTTVPGTTVTLTSAPSPGTGTPTPSGLPDGGTFATTLGFVAVLGSFSALGFFLLRKT